MKFRHRTIQNAYYVTDLDEGIARWHRLWGLGPFIVRRHIALPDVRYRGAPSTVDISAAYVQAGDIMVELVTQHDDAPSAFREMLRTMHHGGSVALLGIMPKDTRIDWDEVIFKGLFMKGVYGREMFETWYKMSSMLQSGLDIGPVITHRLPVEDYREGFEIMGSGRSGKVILDWT